MRQPDAGPGAERNERTDKESAPRPVPEPVDLHGRASEPEVRGQVLDFKVRPAAPRRVALTFDDGPSEWTPSILNLLKTHDAKASFFVVGQHIPGREQILQQIVEQGCEVCNHTWSHPNLEYLGIRETLDELAECSQAICKAGVAAPYFYRPPFLGDTPTARAAGAACGMVVVECDVIAYDWATGDTDEIVEFVMDGVHAGGEIVLLHDGVPPDRDGNRQPTVDAVARLLPELKAKGFGLVTVSELLGRADVSH